MLTFVKTVFLEVVVFPCIRHRYICVSTSHLILDFLHSSFLSSISPSLFLLLCGTANSQYTQFLPQLLSKLCFLQTRFSDEMLF